MNKTVLLILGICVILATFILYYIAIGNRDNEFPLQQNERSLPTKVFDIAQCLKKLPGEGGGFMFLKDLYLDSNDLSTAATFSTQLHIMDSITSDERFNRRTLSNVLTADLLLHNKGKWMLYAPDSLLLLLQWAEPLKYYAQIDQKNSVFYRAVYSYWMNFIAGKLTVFSEQDPSRKYDITFNYVLNRCREQNFTTGVKITPMEKFIDNLINSKWGHLLNATWNQASGWLKMGITIFLSIFAYGVFQLFRQTYRYLKPTK